MTSATQVVAGGETAMTAGTDALLGVYRPAEPVFVAGRDSYLIDEDGREYLDFTSGLGVNAFGYGDGAVRDAIAHALDRGVLHTSNLYRTRPAAELAAELTARSFADRVFFCNSGAEANEGAFKFARRRARAVGGAAKHEIIALLGSFHGRLFGSLAATDRPAQREPFDPLVPGVRLVCPADLDAVRAAVSPERTAAIIAEPVQGEGGIRPLEPRLLAALRELADEADAALIFDEVQCGLGRCGHLFAYEAFGVVPDMVTLAKPLAGGLPMGAVLLSDRIAEAVQPGDHATTFGGGPVVASAALATVRRLADPSLLADVRAKADRVRERLAAFSRLPGVRAVRGLGLMWGVQLGRPVAPVVEKALERQLLVCPAGPDVVRLLPPLSIAEDELLDGIDRLRAAIE